ncbi:MAG: hypothetical protein J6J13_02470 [Clostridia bacterium]|nr:hypothetical protein [Clostridia bacterium]
MIEVCPVKDEKVLQELFSLKGLTLTETSGAVIAKSKGETLGCCLYELDERKIIILFLEPKNDLLMADGVLRSALHVAAERSAMDAFYSEFLDEEIFKKLGFIKSSEQRRLDIDKLFGGCCQEI